MEISNNLLNTLVKTADILNKLNIKYCLIGGLAVSMLSKPRATEDVDFLVLIDEENKNKFITELEKEFKIIQNKPPFSLKNITIWRIILTDKKVNDYGFIILDLIFSESKIHEEALDHCLKINIDNTVVNIASKDSLIKIKERSGRKIDLIDIDSLKSNKDY